LPIKIVLKSIDDNGVAMAIAREETQRLFHPKGTMTATNTM
jgi:hypothetical protein